MASAYHTGQGKEENMSIIFGSSVGQAVRAIILLLRKTTDSELVCLASLHPVPTYYHIAARANFQQRQIIPSESLD